MGRKETRDERNARLREVNRVLKEAGIPSADRQRLRNASPETIAKILETGKAPAKGERATRPEPTRPGPTKPEPTRPGPTKQGPTKHEISVPVRGKSESKGQRLDRLRENYKLLRQAGFSAKDASRLRNASSDTVQKALASKEVPAKKSFYTRKDKVIKPLIWKTALVNYTNRYNVVVAIYFVKPGPEYKIEHVTIQADFELTEEDVNRAVWHIVEQSESEPKDGSDWAYSHHTIRGCYIKEDIPESRRYSKYE